jgi:hypothetical protein
MSETESTPTEKGHHEALEGSSTTNSTSGSSYSIDEVPPLLSPIPFFVRPTHASATKNRNASAGPDGSSSMLLTTPTPEASVSYTAISTEQDMNRVPVESVLGLGTLLEDPPAPAPAPASETSNEDLMRTEAVSETELSDSDERISSFDDSSNDSDRKENVPVVIPHEALRSLVQPEVTPPEPQPPFTNPSHGRFLRNLQRRVTIWAPHRRYPTIPRDNRPASGFWVKRILVMIMNEMIMYEEK